MSGDRWGELSRLIVACALERPERVDEVAVGDLAPGPARDLGRLMRDRRRDGLATDAAALAGLPEVERIGGRAMVYGLLEGIESQSSFPAYAAELRALAVGAGLGSHLADTAGFVDRDHLRAALERLEGAQGAGPDPFVRLADVVEREIVWRWDRRVAVGNVTVIAGDGGVGKSTLAQELGARMTRGQGPPGEGATAPRSVVILTAEEDASAVVRPRMRLMGADLEGVSILDPENFGLTLPSGAPRLAARCRADDVGLVIVDTGPAFLDRGLKSNTEEDVRQFLSPLRALAEELRAVVAVLAHLNKDTTRGARQRVMGGAAWVNAPRHVLLVGAPPGEDPRETGERLVAVEKNNLGQYPPAVAFRLAPAREDATRAVVAWGGEVDGVRASDLVGEPAGPDERAAADEAEEFLRAYLDDGEWHSSGPVKQAAKSEGIAERTLKRAARSLAIETRRVGSGRDKSLRSEWRLVYSGQAYSAQSGPSNDGPSKIPHGKRDLGPYPVTRAFPQSGGPSNGDDAIDRAFGPASGDPAGGES